MLTYATGNAGTPSDARRISQHLLTPTLQPDPARVDAYFSRALGFSADDDYGFTIARPREDLHPVLADLLGLSPLRTPRAQEIAAVLAGRRTDGRYIVGKQRQRSVRSLADELGCDRTRVAAPAEVDQVLSGRRSDTGDPLDARDCPELRRRFLRLYGVVSDEPDKETLANVRAGRRSDGSALDPQAYAAALTASRNQIAFVDLTFSAPKDLSVAWALAPNDAERAILIAAHRGAVDATLREIECVLGRARKGKGGLAGADQGVIAWITFAHMTARPSFDVRSLDAETPRARHKAFAAGDCQIHSHATILNVVLVLDAQGAPIRVGSLDLDRLQGRVQQFGALYQAFLARNLRQVGVEVDLDARTGAARLCAVPAELSERFSKRTARGTETAHEYAELQGLDWGLLETSRKIKRLKIGTQDPRGAKRDDLANFALWRQQARAAGCETVKVIQLTAIGPLPDWKIRAEAARRTALRLLDPRLRQNGSVDRDELSLVATRALIAVGIEAGSEVDELVDLILSGEVTQDGFPTRLIPEGRSGRNGRGAARYVTSATLDREDRLAAMARAAAADSSPALTQKALHAAANRLGMDLSDPVGEASLHAAMTASAARLTTLEEESSGENRQRLRLLISAWTDQGRTVLIVSRSQQTACALSEALQTSCLTWQEFLEGNGRPELAVTSVVMIDELDRLPKSMLLAFLALQAARQFCLVGLLGTAQARPAKTKSAWRWLQAALNDSASNTCKNVALPSDSYFAVRERLQRGQIGGSVSLLRDSGYARLVAGCYGDVIKAIGDLWLERIQAHQSDPEYTILIVAATSSDVQAIGEALRRRRKADIGGDACSVDAIDRLGATFEMRVTVGDRVRISARVNAQNGRGLLGHAGSVLVVEKIDEIGLTLRNRGGRTGLVAWDTLRDRKSRRFRLGYAEVATIAESAIVATTEAIFALPSGSSASDADCANIGLSRGLKGNFLVVSEAAEKREMESEGILGRPLEDEAVWAHVARNLSRIRTSQPLETLQRSCKIRALAGDSFRLGIVALSSLGSEYDRRRSRNAFARWRRSAENLAQAVVRLNNALAQSLEVAAEPARATPLTVNEPEDADQRFVSF